MSVATSIVLLASTSWWYSLASPRHRDLAGQVARLLLGEVRDVEDRDDVPPWRVRVEIATRVTRRYRRGKSSVMNAA